MRLAGVVTDVLRAALADYGDGWLDSPAPVAVPRTSAIPAP